jgi:hypothetical protein
MRRGDENPVLSSRFSVLSSEPVFGLRLSGKQETVETLFAKSQELLAKSCFSC